VGAAKLLATSEGAELVRRCRAGDGAAWEEIVQTYSRRIYNLAYRFTSKADAAEDLTQEVFIRVYRSLDQYNPKQGDLQNWLMRLARNLIIDDYRKRQRAPQDEAARILRITSTICARPAGPSREKWNGASLASRSRPG
jgi:RNA polymerase sigma-70 factor (ECF subfamily)